MANVVVPEVRYAYISNGRLVARWSPFEAVDGEDYCFQTVVSFPRWSYVFRGEFNGFLPKDGISVNDVGVGEQLKVTYYSIKSEVVESAPFAVTAVPESVTTLKPVILSHESVSGSGGTGLSCTWTFFVDPVADPGDLSWRTMAEFRTDQHGYSPEETENILNNESIYNDCFSDVFLNSTPYGGLIPAAYCQSRGFLRIRHAITVNGVETFGPWSDFVAYRR